MELTAAQKIPPGDRKSVIRELGLCIDKRSEVLSGQCRVNTHMFVPGTDCLRLSVMATWADTLLGLIAMRHIAPKVPLTLDLDIHLSRPVKAGQGIFYRCSPVKNGRSIHVFRVTFFDEKAIPYGYSYASFQATPKPELTLPTGNWAERGFWEPRELLGEDLVARTQCQRDASGVVALPWNKDLRNAAGAINGGLLTIAIEEAALAAAAPAQTLSSLSVRYLRGITREPARAKACVTGPLAEVEVYEGSEKLAAVASCRLFGKQ